MNNPDETSQRSGIIAAALDEISSPPHTLPSAPSASEIIKYRWPNDKEIEIVRQDKTAVIKVGESISTLLTGPASSRKVIIHEKDGQKSIGIENDKNASNASNNKTSYRALIVKIWENQKDSTIPNTNSNINTRVSSNKGKDTDTAEINTSNTNTNTTNTPATDSISSKTQTGPSSEFLSQNRVNQIRIRVKWYLEKHELDQLNIQYSGESATLEDRDLVVLDDDNDSYHDVNLSSITKDFACPSFPFSCKYTAGLLQKDTGNGSIALDVKSSVQAQDDTNQEKDTGVVTRTQKRKRTTEAKIETNSDGKDSGDIDHSNINKKKKTNNNENQMDIDSTPEGLQQKSGSSSSVSSKDTSDVHNSTNTGGDASSTSKSTGDTGTDDDADDRSGNIHRKDVKREGSPVIIHSDDKNNNDNSTGAGSGDKPLVKKEGVIHLGSGHQAIIPPMPATNTANAIAIANATKSGYGSAVRVWNPEEFKHRDELYEEYIGKAVDILNAYITENKVETIGIPTSSILMGTSVDTFQSRNKNKRNKNSGRKSPVPTEENTRDSNESTSDSGSGDGKSSSEACEVIDTRKPRIIPRECNEDFLLEEFHNANFDMEVALEKVRKNPSFYLTIWDKHEKDLFNGGFRHHRGLLRRISSDVPTKTYQEVIDFYYRFKVPYQFRKYQEKKREQARKLIQAINEKANNGSVSGDSSSRKGRNWVKGGAVEQRQTHAKDFLVEVRESLGEEKYLELANHLKSFRTKASDVSALKDQISPLLGTKTNLMNRFLEFLPRKHRAC